MEHVTLIIAYVCLWALGFAFIYFASEPKSKQKTN
jgi:hypothetical protein